MTKNKHGIEVETEFTLGGISWTVIQVAEDWVKCISSKIIENSAFDAGKRNDFAASSLRAYLNGEFLKKLIEAGAPEELFEHFDVDLTADDGTEDFGSDRVRIGLITCEDYRRLRKYIPKVDSWWWTATPDSTINPLVRSVSSDGALYSSYAYFGYSGVRPLCCLKSEILVSCLDDEARERRRIMNEKRTCENCGNARCANSLVAFFWDECVLSKFQKHWRPKSAAPEAATCAACENQNRKRANDNDRN